ncbi:hypothetical protein D3C81_2100380 [compost metagenome]
MGTVYVLFHPRIADGVLGDAHPRDPRYSIGLDGRNGHRAVWSVDRFDERYSLLGMAGEALWYA